MPVGYFVKTELDVDSELEMSLLGNICLQSASSFSSLIFLNESNELEHNTGQLYLFDIIINFVTVSFNYNCHFFSFIKNIFFFANLR